DVVMIGDDPKTAEVELRNSNFACQGDGPGRNTAAAVSGIRPVGEVCVSVAERTEFTASQEFAVSDASHGEGKPYVSEAFSFPSSDNVFGVLERGHEVVGEVKASSMLGVTVGFEQERGVTRHEERESDDTIAQLRDSG